MNGPLVLIDEKVIKFETLEFADVLKSKITINLRFMFYDIGPMVYIR